VDTTAVVFERPGALGLQRLTLSPPSDGDVVVDVEWTGISTGTERLLWTGTMPAFPGMGYPLVPGYEAVGRVVEAGATSGRRVGDPVFVGGAHCFPDVRCLFGSSARHLVVPGARTQLLEPTLGDRATLLALAATAYNALRGGRGLLPDLIVGHGALGRLLARLTMILDPARVPTVWENNGIRMHGARGYPVIDASADNRRDYHAICDVSGDLSLIDPLIGRLAPGGELCLAGFYSAESIAFRFTPAFMRGARIRIAAQWQPSDLVAVTALANSGALALDDIITHHTVAEEAASAYATAFEDPSCVKMVLDWSHVS
jgi:bacteriochlorophyllide a dehydrogenase